MTNPQHTTQVPTDALRRIAAFALFHFCKNNVIDDHVVRKEIWAADIELCESILKGQDDG